MKMARSESRKISLFLLGLGLVGGIVGVVLFKRSKQHPQLIVQQPTITRG